MSSGNHVTETTRAYLALPDPQRAQQVLLEQRPQDDADQDRLVPLVAGQAGGGEAVVIGGGLWFALRPDAAPTPAAPGAWASAAVPAACWCSPCCSG